MGRERQNEKGLCCGISTRQDGSMHRHLRKDNRDRYFREIGIDPQKVAMPDAVHGAGVAVATETMGGTLVPEMDGLTTARPGLFLALTVSDCFPLFFYDPERPAVGIAHSGWRGTLKNIAGNMIRTMKDEFEADPKKLLTAVGPGIRDCHFEISGEDKDLYREYDGHILTRRGRVFVDLPGIIKDQLEQAGLRKGNIEDVNTCTACHAEEYFSFRRDKPKETESMVAYIGIA